ncbi:MAG: hypothetical protein AAF621_03695 [Pseudomonadota bacterium]
MAHFLNTAMHLITLLKIVEGTEPVRNRYRRYMQKIADFRGVVSFRDAGRPEHHSDNVRQIYKISVLVSKLYKIEFIKNRLVKLSQDYLMIGSVTQKPNSNLVECLCYPVDISQLFTQE